MPRDMIDQEKSHAGLIKITKKLEDVTTMKQSCEQVSFKSWIKVGIVLHRFVMICHAVRVQVKYDIYHPHEMLLKYCYRHTCEIPQTNLPSLKFNLINLWRRDLQKYFDITWKLNQAVSLISNHISGQIPPTKFKHCKSVKLPWQFWTPHFVIVKKCLE